jgi:hypothetical protein
MHEGRETHEHQIGRVGWWSGGWGSEDDSFGSGESRGRGDEFEELFAEVQVVLWYGE